MDKYLSVVLIFCVVGIPISFVSPTTGELRDPPFLLLFYASIGGIILIVFYNSYKERKLRDKETPDKRRKSKK